MSGIRKIEFPEKDLPLRDDVRVLGQMLGEVLVEQHGPALLDEVETIRKAAILRREGDAASAAVLEESLGSLPMDRIRSIIKAFASYLRLANLAEKVHRIRRRREYLKQDGPAQRGSLDAVIGELCGRGVQAEALLQVLENLLVQPVFTAHPTEATRRSILQKEYSIIHRLVERLNPDLTPRERQQALARIRDAVTSGWQTRAVARARPTVADELDNVLFYVTEILYRVIPPFDETLREVVGKHYGPEVAARLGDSGLRFGSWVGGDMDGNPNVTADTILETLATQRRMVINLYLPEVRRLGQYLSQTRGEAGILDALEQRLARYGTELPGVLDQIPGRHHEMPYRCFLHMVASRLRDTRDDAPHAYRRVEEFHQDVALVAESLEANKGRHAGLFGARRLLIRARACGFHLATLDVRQDAELHRRVMGEILGIGDWSSWAVPDRVRHLAELLEAAELPDTGSPGELSGEARETLRVFEALSDARQRFGEAATGLFIISMTQGADDVLTVLALSRIACRAAGKAEPVQDVVPLLETVDDLDAGPAILEGLLDCGPYRRHLQIRGNRQVIMIGYSDSNKDSGIVASRWGLQQAQFRLARRGRARDVEIVFFHGRGGTVSRGGGNLVNGIAGAPEGTVNGYLRVTEQGEVINQKYGIRPIALRNLELVAGAVLQHDLGEAGQHSDHEMRALMQVMAAAARTHYRDLVYGHPDFVSFFRSATPIDVIERLAIGSRPASRRGGAGVENLRAIPWVFSWAQTRIGLPGVFGMGTALENAAGEHGIEALRDLYRRWSFFRGMINDVEMVLAKSELEIGRRYAQLAPAAAQPVFDLIFDEFQRAERHVLELKQNAELLEDQHALQRNIRLRNPYVDPMHIVQIDLLRRWRAGGRTDDELLNALKATVSGIALGIQNTG